MDTNAKEIIDDNYNQNSGSSIFLKSELAEILNNDPNI